MIDIHKTITETNDVEYLKELDRYIDIDIQNLKNESNAISELKAKMRNISVEKYKTKQEEGLNEIKQIINKRIKELCGTN